jgi:hypothetical protein
MQHFMINQNYSFINLLFFHLILFLFKLIPLFFHFKNASQISNFILFPTLILFFLLINFFHIDDFNSFIKQNTSISFYYILIYN